MLHCEYACGRCVEYLKNGAFIMEEENIVWRPGMKKSEEDLYFADFFSLAERREQVEKKKIDREQSSTANQLKNLLVEAVTGKEPKRPQPKGEPWLPEYDDVVVSFWTPKELKDLKAKGLNDEQLAGYTKRYIRDNAWNMEKWKTGSKEEYMKQFDRNPTLYTMEIVHLKDSKRGIPLSEWGYPDVKSEFKAAEKSLAKEKPVANKEEPVVNKEVPAAKAEKPAYTPAPQRSFAEMMKRAHGGR